MTEKDLMRPIKSFVIRGSRMTASQQRAFDDYWDQQGLTTDEGVIDRQALFGRQAPLVLEIGFGMGASLAEMAENYPNIDFIGVEVHKPGIGNLLKEINLRILSNVRIFWEDIMLVLDKCCPLQFLDRVQIFFPDPWHKRRHHKRRLLQEPFVQLLRSRLKLGGMLHIATDWQDYAKHILELMQSAQGFRNTVNGGGFAERPDYRPVTKFEQRGQRLGHGVWDLLFERIA